MEVVVGNTTDSRTSFAVAFHNFHSIQSSSFLQYEPSEYKEDKENKILRARSTLAQLVEFLETGLSTPISRFFFCFS